MCDLEFLSKKTELRITTRVKSNCDVKANFSLIFCNSEILSLFNNTKVPSYVTRKFYLYLTTLKFRVTQLGNLNFIKKSELLHQKNHLNLCAKFSANSWDLLEFQAVFLIGPLN